MSLKQRLRTITPRRVFLLDGVGALLSAFLLGVVLVRFETSFGMPPRVLYILAAIALGFAIFSLSSSISDSKNWRIRMRAIATANLLYCALTLGLVIYLHPGLRLLGSGYFVAEITVVAALALAEFRVASRKSS